MKKLLCFLLLCLTSDSFCLSRLLSRTSQAPRAVRRPAPPAAQKRTLMTPAQIKGMYDPLTEIAKPVSPVVGAVKYETGALQRMYEVPSETSAIKLVQELFYQQESQFKPTANKSKAAYALSPSILGLVIGALEAGKLKDPTIRKDIIRRWQNEFKNLTGEKRAFSENKINKLLELIEAEYEHDTNSCRSILLGFLYAKADPDDNHDMIHYLSSLNQYISVFENTARPIAQKMLPKKEETFFNWLSSKIQSLKQYVEGGNAFTPEQYQETRSQLNIVRQGIKLDKAFRDKFELIIATILDEKKGPPGYPRKVIQSEYGYDGQKRVPNCVEAAMQDLFNIIIYDPESRSFDLSRLLQLKGVVLNENFKKFYQDYKSESKINSKEAGQAWMNLVSAVPGVLYVQNNYELAGINTENNLLVLSSYFLGTTITNLDELGKVLSDAKTTIIFNEQSIFSKDSKIVMKIITKDKILEAYLCFRSGHGYLQVPARKINLRRALLEERSLAKKYKINHKARLLYESQGDVFWLLDIATQKPQINTSGSYHYTPISYVPLQDEEYISSLRKIISSVPTSLYYIKSIESFREKSNLIKIILNRSNAQEDIENIDNESLDYAYHLFSQLPETDQQEIIYPMIVSGIRSSKWSSSKMIKALLINNIDKVLNYLFRDSKMSIDKRIQLIQELYEQTFDDALKEKFIRQVLEYIVRVNNIAIETISGIYELCADKTFQKKFWPSLLEQLKNPSASQQEEIKKILINAGAKKTRIHEKERTVNE